MKNKSLILNIALVAVSALVLVFLALPYCIDANGYEFLEGIKYVGEMDFSSALIYVTPLILLISSILLLASSVLGLLGSVKVIKSEKLAKVIKIVNIVLTGIIAFFAVVAFIILLVKDFVSPQVGIILNLIVGVAALVASILDLVWKK